LSNEAAPADRSAGAVFHKLLRQPIRGPSFMLQEAKHERVTWIIGRRTLTTGGSETVLK
jgi:hypothetical protein